MRLAVVALVALLRGGAARAQVVAVPESGMAASSGLGAAAAALAPSLPAPALPAGVSPESLERVKAAARKAGLPARIFALSAGPPATAVGPIASAPKRYRSIFLSDIHLGTKESQTALLLDFLRKSDSENLYLVGDIIDGRRLKRGWNGWGPQHTAVLDEIFDRAQSGVNVVYVPGNHDEAARLFAGRRIGGVPVELEAAHVTADGRKLWVIHGDRFDNASSHSGFARWLAHCAHHGLLAVNRWFNAVRLRRGSAFLPLSAFLKRAVGFSAKFIRSYEQTVAREAKARGFEGVVSGHVHMPGIGNKDGVLYCNGGDWVENCSALVEHHDGRLELVRNDRLP